MTYIPILCGAGLAFALGGAIAGSTLGSAAISNRSAGGNFYQSHETGSMDPQKERPLPDHYPLVTRSGVVPVEQLSDRGLFSQKRYQPVFAFVGDIDSSAADPGPGFDADEPSISEPRVADHGPMPVEGPPDDDRADTVIDVQATLAMR